MINLSFLYYFHILAMDSSFFVTITSNIKVNMLQFKIDITYIKG